MGQGGFYTLVNATPYTWFKTHQHSYQMNAWSFPDTVAPYTAINVYVEFDEGTGKHTGDDGGEVDFEVGPERGKGTKFELTVHFRWLGLRLIEFPVTYGPNGDVEPVGKELNFGWAHDGFTKFTLTGEPGNFVVVQNQ